MTIVGISTHYIDFLMVAWEGVMPPIYKAETSYILCAPAFYIVWESLGQTEITYKIGVLELFINFKYLQIF